MADGLLNGIHLGANRVSSPSMVAIPELEPLVTAIVARAVADYRYSIGGEWDEIFAWIDDPVKEECEEFFRSEWFELLTGLDGEWVMKEIQKEVGYVEQSNG